MHPTLHDDTAVTEARYLSSSVRIPDRSLPDPNRLWRIREIDVGPHAKHGIASYPVKEGREYPQLVPGR